MTVLNPLRLWRWLTVQDYLQKDQEVIEKTIRRYSRRNVNVQNGNILLPEQFERRAQQIDNRLPELARKYRVA